MSSNHSVRSFSMVKPKVTQVLCKEEVQNNEVYLADRSISDLFLRTVLTSVSCSM